MTMTAVSIKIPETMTEYAEPKDESMLLSRNAMILYPYIQNETISFGKAAHWKRIADAEHRSVEGG